MTLKSHFSGGLKAVIKAILNFEATAPQKVLRTEQVEFFSKLCT